MSDTAEMLILILPHDGDAAMPWLHVVDGVIIARGAGEPEALDGARVIAFAPAEDIGIGWLDLPDVPRAQRDAIARQQLGDQIIGGSGELHIASQVDVAAWLAPAVMDQWLSRLPVLPDSIIPAALAIQAPDQGLVSATVAGSAILRGKQLAVAGEPGMIAAFGAPDHILSDAAVEAALVAAAADPPLDLMTGRYAQHQSVFDAKGLVRLAQLAAVALGLLLVLMVAQILATDHAAERLEESARARAAEQFPGSADPMADLNARLAASQGGGAGFLRTMAAVTGAISGNPLAELTRARFDATGVLEVGLRVPKLADVAGVKSQIEASGFAVDQGVPSTEQGRTVVQLRVRGS